MKNLRRSLILALTCAAAPGFGATVYAGIDLAPSDTRVNTRPTTSDYDTVTDDTMILDEPLTQDLTSEEMMAAPPISARWDTDQAALVPLDKNSDLAKQVKLQISKNSALSPGGQDVQLFQQGNQVSVQGTVSSATEANYISMIVNRLAKDQTVVNNIQLIDDSIVDHTMESY